MTSREAIQAPAGLRLDYLDATRAFALVLGIVFHASLSFAPVFIGWAVQDVSTSPAVLMFMAVSHSFRMELFFMLAGFFSHLTFHREGLQGFAISRLLRIVVPFLAGWFLLRPLMVSGWIMGGQSLRGNVDVPSGLIGGFQSLSSLPAGIFTGTHLWFLYYLALITGLSLAGRSLLRRAKGCGRWVDRADGFLKWLSRSPACIAILVIPTSVVMWFMRGWTVDTPDKSLWPHLPAIVLYGGFFVLGWMMGRQRELLESFAGLTPSRWISVAFAIVATLAFGSVEQDPAHPRYAMIRAVHGLAYAWMMWSLVFLTLGVIRRYFAKPSAVSRYLADCSYWMYLVHLPVVVWLQVAVAEWPLHWSIKLVGVSAAAVGVAVISYDLWVRSTFIGQILNGRRRDRAIFRSKSSHTLGASPGGTPVQQAPSK